MHLARRSLVAAGASLAVGCIQFPKFRSGWTYEGGSLLADPFFDRVAELWDGTPETQLAFHWRDSTVGAATAAISRTGGVLAGVLQISTTGTTIFGAVSSLPRSGAQYITGEWVRLNVRVRKTNTPSLSAGSFQVVTGGADADGVMDVSAAGTALELTHTAISSWTVNEWQEYEATFQMANVPKNQAQKPYAVVSLQDGATKLDAATNLEFDAVNLTRIATP